MSRADDFVERLETDNSRDVGSEKGFSPGRLGRAARGAGPEAACTDRRDLRAWSNRGGRLPMTLAFHVVRCPGCADQVRRMNRVFAGLNLLRHEPVPVGGIHRAHARALRMVRRAARVSEAAQRILRMRPNLTPWERARIHAARYALAATAAGLLLVSRAGLLSGFERSRTLGHQLAALHWERHIDPEGEWLGSPYDDRLA